MALLDSIVGACFRDEKAGRVVIFSGDRRARGYIVRSESEELKIRSFLKMFYFAHFSILFPGYFLASEWSRDIYHALGRPADRRRSHAPISAGPFPLHSLRTAAAHDRGATARPAVLAARESAALR